MIFLKTHLKLISAGLMLILGFCVVFFGCSVINQSVQTYSNAAYVSQDYNVDSGKFGADFYTYMYEASDVIVDELDDISESIGTIVDGQNAVNRAIRDNRKALYNTSGSVICAIGWLIVAMSLPQFAAAIPDYRKESPDAEKIEVVSE